MDMRGQRIRWVAYTPPPQPSPRSSPSSLGDHKGHTRSLSSPRWKPQPRSPGVPALPCLVGSTPQVRSSDSPGALIDGPGLPFSEPACPTGPSCGVDVPLSLSQPHTRDRKQLATRLPDPDLACPAERTQRQQSTALMASCPPLCFLFMWRHSWGGGLRRKRGPCCSVNTHGGRPGPPTSPHGSLSSLAAHSTHPVCPGGSAGGILYPILSWGAPGSACPS